MLRDGATIHIRVTPAMKRPVGSSKWLSWQAATGWSSAGHGRSTLVAASAARGEWPTSRFADSEPVVFNERATYGRSWMSFSRSKSRVAHPSTRTSRGVDTTIREYHQSITGHREPPSLPAPAPARLVQYSTAHQPKDTVNSATIRGGLIWLSFASFFRSRSGSSSTARRKDPTHASVIRGNTTHLLHPRFNRETTGKGGII